MQNKHTAEVRSEPFFCASFRKKKSKVIGGVDIYFL